MCAQPQVGHRGWVGLNYHLSAPEFSHSCHLHLKQLLSKGAHYIPHILPFLFLFLVLFFFLSHSLALSLSLFQSHTHQTHTQTHHKPAVIQKILLFHRNHNTYIPFKLLTSPTLFLGRLEEFLEALCIHQGALVWHLWWVKLNQACCVAFCVGTRHLTYFHESFKTQSC